MPSRITPRTPLRSCKNSELATLEMHFRDTRSHRKLPTPYSLPQRVLLHQPPALSPLHSRTFTSQTSACCLLDVGCWMHTPQTNPPRSPCPSADAAKSAMQTVQRPRRHGLKRTNKYKGAHSGIPIRQDRYPRDPPHPRRALERYR
ncbi:hypothetical protein BU16DRAFT_524698 [Lophium mytilinum]|uniref:Uncharacterized protein n=1 Tax=Lophium mytilinum TaxID=390894 RepID=A0A6A6R1N7_9PEZI|nr:hypothetical protein BU16DRAFT_524698 [Lophium mytilinum]